MSDIYIYIIIMALVTLSLRIIPMTILKKPIRNTFIKSFLYYVPYVTLATMCFPAIIYATLTPISGILAFITGLIVAYFGGNLFKVSASCVLVVFILELILVH